MKKKVIILIACLSLFIVGGVAFGQTDQPNNTSVTLTNPLQCPTLSDCVSRLINALFIVGAPLCALMVMVGGYQIMFAAGDPEKFKTGRQTLTYAAVGFALLLLAQGVQFIILSIFNQT